jgi:hypothetical protein
VLISAREAAQILAATGLARERARRVLLAGFAGEGMRTRGSLLYDEARVRALLEWPTVDPSALDGACPSGIFVARVMDLRVMDMGTHPIADRMWQLSPYARLQIRLAIETQGYLPFVATVCGFVASGANITAVWPSPSGSNDGSTLDLAEPGEWFEPFNNSRFVTGPGGVWLLWRTRQATLQHGPLQE